MHGAIQRAATCRPLPTRLATLPTVYLAFYINMVHMLGYQAYVKRGRCEQHPLCYGSQTVAHRGPWAVKSAWRGPGRQLMSQLAMNSCHYGRSCIIAGEARLLQHRHKLVLVIVGHLCGGSEGRGSTGRHIGMRPQCADRTATWQPSAAAQCSNAQVRAATQAGCTAVRIYLLHPPGMSCLK